MCASSSQVKLTSGMSWLWAATVSLLIHSSESASISHSIQQSFTQTIIQHRDRGKSLSGRGRVGAGGTGGTGGQEGALSAGRGGAQVTAMNLISSRTCNLTGRGMHYWSYIFLVLLQSLASKQNREGAREIKKNNKCGCGGPSFPFCFRTELRMIRLERRWRRSAVEVGGYKRQGVLVEFRLYRLVASATLPPANQVRDKHEDDKEAECHAHSDGHQKAQIRVQEALVSWRGEQ